MDVTPVLGASSGSEHGARKKPPTARRQTRERVGSRMDSADTLANYEDHGAKHVNTLDRDSPEANG